MAEEKVKKSPAQLYREQADKIAALAAIYEVSKAVTSTLKLHTALGLITEKVTQIIGADVCSLRLLDDRREALTLAVSYGYNEQYMRAERVLKPGESLSGLAVQTREPVFCEDVQSDPRYAFPELAREEGLRSLLSVPLIDRGIPLGVLSVYTKRVHHFSPDEVKILAMFASQAAIAVVNARFFEELRRDYLDSIKALASALEAKDAYTRGHSEMVMEYSMAIAEELGLPEREKKNIHYASLLHDIGKIGISTDILQKPDKLTPEEWDIVMTHPKLGADIVERIGILHDLAPLILYHHEKYDGKGYPSGLKDVEIPIGARILAVADAFQAMTSHRPYRAAMSRDEAKAELKRFSGTQFDPRIVKVFLKILEEEEGKGSLEQKD